MTIMNAFQKKAAAAFRAEEELKECKRQLEACRLRDGSANMETTEKRKQSMPVSTSPKLSGDFGAAVNNSASK